MAISGIGRFTSVSRFTWIAVASALAALFLSPAHACPGPADYHQGTVSASFFANALASPGSLFGDAPGIIRRGVALARAADAQCGAGAARRSVKLGIVPSRYLSGYAEDAQCNAQLATTRAAPLRFPERRFGGVDGMMAWFSDFSQGSGADGRALYAACPGLCSPRYFAELREDGGALVADVSVVCGPARDKGDNRYRIRAAVGPHGRADVAGWLR